LTRREGKVGEEGGKTKGWVRPKPRHKNSKHLPSAWTRQLEEISHKAGQRVTANAGQGNGQEGKRISTTTRAPPQDPSTSRANEVLTIREKPLFEVPKQRDNQLFDTSTRQATDLMSEIEF